MQNYLPWLDLLRFVACGLVIVNHLNPYTTAENLGHNGVGLFFSISGFLIGSILMAEHGKPGWLSRFYAGRLLRIYPPLLLGLLFYGGLLWAWSLSGDTRRGDDLGQMLKNWVYYLTFTKPLSPDSASGFPYGIVWSLCVEEYFYLLMPIAFWLFGPRVTAFGLVAVAAIIAEPQFQHLREGFNTNYLIPVNLMAGVVLATARPAARPGLPWVGVIGLALVIANAATGYLKPFGPIMGVVTTAVVWSFATTRVAMPAALAPLVTAGKWSYGIYLLHLPFCSAALRICEKAGLRKEEPVSYYAAAAVLATVGSTLMAGLMYRLYEKPILASRPWVYERPWARYLFAGLQVSLVPAGILYWWVTVGSAR
jgi:peptidoglycan/LPS O-acetylase OafA/YrhL